MPVSSLYGTHSAIKSYGATWSAPTGTIDSAYPLTNQNSVYADVVTKFTGTSGTLRGTIASTAIQAIGLINCSQSLAGLTGTVTNGGGMASQNIVVPALSADGVSLNAWVDLRTVTTASTTWDVAFTGAPSAIGIGKVILIAALTEFDVRVGVPVGERKPSLFRRTEYGVARGYRKNVRYRTWQPQFMREEQRAAYTALRRGSEGPTQPFIFILDSTVNDIAYCWFPTEQWEHQRFPTHSPTTDRFEEVNPGLAF